MFIELAGILFVNPRERSFLSNLERAVGQPIEKMDIPDNELINNNRIKKLQEKLINAASTERDDPEEASILEKLIKRIRYRSKRLNTCRFKFSSWF